MPEQEKYNDAGTLTESSSRQHEHLVSQHFLPPGKFILDACCGGRMMWTNKNHPNAIYIDNREVEAGHIQNG